MGLCSSLVSLSLFLCLCISARGNLVRILTLAAGGHRDLPHREEAGQLQALRRGHPPVHDRGRTGNVKCHVGKSLTPRRYRCASALIMGLRRCCRKAEQGRRLAEFTLCKNMSARAADAPSESASEAAQCCLQQHIASARSSICPRTSWTARPAPNQLSLHLACP